MNLTRLSDIQREIIPLVQLQAKVPLGQIAKQLGNQEGTIRYQVSSLEQRSIIKDAPFLNIYPLGYRYVNLYFSLSARRSSELDSFLKVLITTPRVMWVAELGGDFQFGMSLMVRQIEEVKDILNELSRKFPEIFFEKSYVFHLGLTVFPAKFLSTKKFSFPELKYGDTGKQFTPDELDKKILIAMAKEYLTSGRAIARSIGHPPATVELRLRHLEEAGVIAGYWYLFDVTKLGYQTLKLLVYAKGHSHLLASELKRFAKAHPHISYFIECLGDWDFELGLDVQDASFVGQVIRELLNNYGSSITTVKTVPMFRVLKWQPLTALE